MTDPSSSTPSIVTELTGDLFALAPSDAILVHACNCRGEWSAGIARVFRDLFPKAYLIYRNHCHSNDPSSLLGTTLLIPPQPSELGDRKNWIACLFTSVDYGRKKGKPESILAASRGALMDLKAQLEENGKGKEEERPGEIWGCRFNSKRFGVEWGRTKRVVEEVGVGITIVEIA